MSRFDPDLILGWNVLNFDLDFLARRCEATGLPFALARGGEGARILQPQSPGGSAGRPGAGARRARWHRPAARHLPHLRELRARARLAGDAREGKAPVRRRRQAHGNRASVSGGPDRARPLQPGGLPARRADLRACAARGLRHAPGRDDRTGNGPPRRFGRRLRPPVPAPTPSARARGARRRCGSGRLGGQSRGVRARLEARAPR